MEVAGVSLPVIEAHCDYKRPARYDDEIEVRTEGQMLSAVRMRFNYTVCGAKTAWSRPQGTRCMRRWILPAVRAGCPRRVKQAFQ